MGRKKTFRKNKSRKELLISKESTSDNRKENPSLEPCGINKSLVCLKTTPAVTSPITTPSPKSRPKSNKSKNRPPDRNRIDKRQKKKGKSRSSVGFVVASAQKRKQLRSYWMRR